VAPRIGAILVRLPPAQAFALAMLIQLTLPLVPLWTTSARLSTMGRAYGP